MKKRGINKKAQFYLIAAVIIVAIIISLSTITNYIITKKKPIKFYDLSSEISEEGARVVDYGIYNEEEIPKIIENFTDEYLVKYSEKKEMGTELVFVYGNRDNVTIASYTSEKTGTVSVSYGSSIFELTGESKYVAERESFVPSEGYTINVKVLGAEYSFYLKEGENFFFVINKKTEEETYIARSET